MVAVLRWADERGRLPFTDEEVRRSGAIAARATTGTLNALVRGGYLARATDGAYVFTAVREEESAAR